MQLKSRFSVTENLSEYMYETSCHRSVMILCQVCAEDADEDMKEMEEVKERHAEEQAALPVSGETVASVTKTPDTQQLVFVLVGMSEEKRQHYSKVVEELGATVTHCPTFNPEVTHLVAESLSRSERTLAAIASGKWVLHDSYLDHSHRAGHFLKVGGESFGTFFNNQSQVSSLHSSSTVAHPVTHMLWHHDIILQSLTCECGNLWGDMVSCKLYA